MKWVITKDHIDRNVARGSGNELLLNEYRLPIKFRLYDDDHVLYYEGVASEANFDPLDWAERYAGCTYMTVWNPKARNWEIL